jgi:hypothetical protein
LMATIRGCLFAALERRYAVLTSNT